MMKKTYTTKKLVSPEEYKIKISELRKKVSSLQKQRNNLLEIYPNKDQKLETNF